MTYPKVSAVVLICLGLSACSAPTSDAAFCTSPEFKGAVGDLREGLEAHPETPQAVGEAGTDVVLGYEAGCT